MNKQKKKALTFWLPPNRESWEDMKRWIGMEDDPQSYEEGIIKLHKLKDRIAKAGGRINLIHSTSEAIRAMMEVLGLDPDDKEKGAENVVEVFRSKLPEFDLELEECALNVGFNPEGPMQRT